MKLTTIKRRLFGKGFQTFKRVVIPCCVVFFIFNFMTAGPASNSGSPPDEENMIVPGEALDPIMKKSHKFDQKHKLEEDHKRNSVHFHPKEQTKIEENSEVEPVHDAFEESQNDLEERSNHDNSKNAKTSFSNDDIPPRMKTSWSMAKANIPDMEKVKFKGHAITNDTVTLTLMSSADKVFMSINKKEIYRGLDKRGLHVVILNQYNGRVMAKRIFDTFQKGVEEDFVDFIDDITTGRIIVLAAEDEISTGLTWKGRNKLKELGCRFAEKISYRDMWAMVTRKDGFKIAETFSNVATADTGYEWGGPIFMRTDFDLEEHPVECDWPFNERNQARRLFCVRYEGYGKLCRCDVKYWQDVFFEVDQKLHHQLASNPLFKQLAVVILSTNRPHSLYRTLKSLHEAPGFNKDLVAIYNESPTREVINLAKLFGVTIVETKNFADTTEVVKIRHKMQRVFRDIIGAHFDPAKVPEGGLPDSEIPPISAQNILILEEDLAISIDIFKYLHSMSPLLERDETIMGISAFNYHGYRGVIESQTISYRTTTPQNLAIMLPARTVHGVLAPNWPSVKNENSEWYYGLDVVMKGAKSIIYPEIPRAKHSSYEGYLIKGQIQFDLFKDHMISLTTNYEIPQKEIDRLVLANYEEHMTKTLKNSEELTFNFCLYDLPYDSKPYVMYVNFDSKDYADFSYVMKCLKTWNLYPVGDWRGVWSFHYHGHPLSIVGVPMSAYSSLKSPGYELIKSPTNNSTQSPSSSSEKS